jgi:heme/copper-type cytochrome/quinol oxidase subunit 2
MNFLVKYWKKIPQRHYFPIFVFASLFFVTNELVVISLIVLYVVAEKQIRNVVSKVAKNHEELLWISAFIFFLVMVDDTLLYFSIMALIVWDTRRRNLQKTRKNEKTLL